MKSDRELLELAAKAAGIPILAWNDKIPAIITTGPKAWNPITNVADRYEFCKKLDLCLDFEIKAVYNKRGMGNWTNDEDEGRTIVEFAGRTA